MIKRISTALLIAGLLVSPVAALTETQKRAAYVSGATLAALTGFVGFQAYGEKSAAVKKDGILVKGVAAVAEVKDANGKITTPEVKEVKEVLAKEDTSRFSRTLTNTKNALVNTFSWNKDATNWKKAGVVATYAGVAAGAFLAYQYVMNSKNPVEAVKGIFSKEEISDVIGCPTKLEAAQATLAKANEEVSMLEILEASYTKSNSKDLPKVKTQIVTAKKNVATAKAAVEAIEAAEKTVTPAPVAK